MINKNSKQLIKIASFVLLGSLFLLNCEPDSDSLGEQFVLGNASQGNEVSYDVTAYNINNNDSIRSDYSQLYRAGAARLGAFNEAVFGMQKASYVSQLRMSSYEPEFGTNAVVDSVVLVLYPTYASDSATITTDEDYIYPDGDIDAKKVVTSYPVYKYGKAKLGGTATTFNIKVHEVNEFLKSVTDEMYSDKVIGYKATEIGSKVFNGNVSSTAITQDSDNASLWANETSLRIPLDATFFQNKIINQEGTNALRDAANFIRHFYGLRISVDETDGYLFAFNPDTAKVLMYYSHDESGETEQDTFEFSMGGSINVHLGQYEYDRTGTLVADALATANSTTGDAKLYLQGMGGPSVGFRIPDATIAELRSKLSEDKIGIISAKVRVYTDETIWDNSYSKPSTFTLLMDEATSFLSDMSTFASVGNYALVKAYNTDSNPAYYDFTITKSIKDIVEENESNTDFILNIGNFAFDSSLQYYGYQYTTRVMDPYRLVLVGTDSANDNRIQLKLIYGSK